MKKQPQEISKANDLPFSTAFQYIKFVTKPHKWWAISAMLVVIVAATLEQSVSYLFKLIIDAVEAGDTSRAMLWGLLFPVSMLIIGLSFRLSGLTGMQWANRTRKEGYDYLFQHTLKHSHNYFSNRFAGSIHSKIRNIVEGVDDLIPEILWTYINSLVSFLVTLVFIIMVDVLSAVIFVALAVCLIIANKKLAPKKQKLSYLQAEAGSKLHASMIDIISNISATRQYSRTPDEQKHIAELTMNLRSAGVSSWRRTEFMLFVNGVIIFLFSFAMFYVLVGRWSAAEITTGEFVLVAALISQISGTLIFIGRAFNSTARTFGEIKEGFAELLLPFEIVDIENAKTLSVTEGTIVWNNVTFKFQENTVFRDFDLTIKAGQRVGLVGPSGAGKTTFVSLLLRQFDLNSGNISIDGQAIHEVTQDSLRSNISVVPQEPSLFHRTIRENIAYGKLDATDEEIIEVAKKAQAHDFISQLPEGYNTLVGERGIKLSGGQKQRVAIARAMLKDTPILLLDEATSALDSESEVEIQKALHVLMAGKTVVAIAHRLSTLREMDRIIVLENGKIVEDGTHETLSHFGGVYQRLWDHQAGGFLLENNSTPNNQ